MDLEAIGLILLALGVFVLGFLVPVVPTGELGQRLRDAVLSRIGWGAYGLPWPALVLGGLFLLRRNPRTWPRMLVGYLVLVFGLWGLLMLGATRYSGVWGAALRRALSGGGWLAFFPFLFFATLGFELIMAWRPTRIFRSAAILSIELAKDALKAGWSLRRRMKDRASFYADVALVKGALAELDRDLLALMTLYPGSAELGKWRKALKASHESLRNPDRGEFEDAQANLSAWQSAVVDFARDRAIDLQTHFQAEGVANFFEWSQGLRVQLEDPIGETSRLGRQLDGLRNTLALDLTGLVTRHQRLLHERDVTVVALPELRPRELAKASSRHAERLLEYQQISADATGLEADADLLEVWRELSGRFLRLCGEFPQAEPLETFEERLIRELRSEGRKQLMVFEEWQRELDAVEIDLRKRDAVVSGGIAAVGGQEISPPGVAVGGHDPFERYAAADGGGIDADFFEMPLEGEVRFEGLDAIDAAGGWVVSEPGLVEAADEDESLEEGRAPEVVEFGGIPIQLPSFEHLDPSEQQNEDPAQLAKEVQERVRKIDETLSNFSLQGRVVASVRGPTVTRFEVEPAPGEKISRFANLSDDLALAMAVGSVRIEAPIPGKSVIGLEVPNARRDLIKFREAAESVGFRRSKARLPLILGKSIDGEMVIKDLARMPHLLIAGSTGSGKSVAVNTLIGSLLYKFLPTELRFLMIDPKMVELTPYDGIPHLLRPVVTNPSDSAGVLLGAVAHMERRYKMMSKIGAKNLDQYNEKARNLDLPQMPFIIVIIDELADLMITSPKEVESAIMRLAQMARATGMHLVLATQRPSVDILTSLIKVNVPARIAFAVSSGHDSRTILDSMGAERLVGLGDMLFYQPGMVKAARLQGPFISESEIANLSGFLRRQYFDDEFVEAYGDDFDPPVVSEAEGEGLIDWNDDKLRSAAELVIAEGHASVSRLQRRLSVGHARAGKLMDSLEALGVVGPHLGSKPREVLVATEELPEIFGK
ncbi:MAG: DNA translocase FtsK [Trueperaceae bacterium]|nr:MAG: DNA translocase FtsK [Trueperaceae bacterium]